MKVGDYVITLKTSGCNGFIAGEVYQISRISDPNTKYMRIYVPVDSRGSNTNGWNAEFFRLHKELNDFQPQLKEILNG